MSTTNKGAAAPGTPREEPSETPPWSYVWPIRVLELPAGRHLLEVLRAEAEGAAAGPDGREDDEPGLDYPNAGDAGPALASGQAVA
jgi:hypothetical protein